jgi:hypothetical protein
MLTRTTVLAIAAAAVTAVACGSDKTTQPVSKTVTFTANLTPAGELGATLNGNPSGSGQFTATLDTATHLFSYTVTFSGLTSNVNNGHIHGPFVVGGASNAAGVILNFNPSVVPGVTFTGLGTATSGTASGTVTLTAANTFGNSAVHGDSIEKLLLAGATYVNIHTATNPAGEIRAQIVKQ